jgi:hypothetical protein
MRASQSMTLLQEKERNDEYWYVILRILTVDQEYGGVITDEYV